MKQERYFISQYTLVVVEVPVAAVVAVAAAAVQRMGGGGGGAPVVTYRYGSRATTVVEEAERLMMGTWMESRWWQPATTGTVRLRVG